jgi:O-antigen ligase
MSRPFSLWLNPAGTVADSPYDTLEGSPVDRLYYSTLLIVGFVILYMKRVKWGVLAHVNVPLLIFIFYCTLSMTWSDFPFTAFKRWVKAIGDYIMVLILLTESNTYETIKSTIKRIAFILLPLSIVFIKYFPEYGRIYHRWTGETMYAGVTTHKNTLGLLCMMLGFFLFYYLIQALREKSDPSGRRRDIILCSLMLVFVFWLLILARSATALFTLVISIGFLAMLSLPFMRRRPEYIGLFFLSCLVLAAVAILIADVFPMLFAMLGRDITMTGRTDFWRDVIWKPNQAHNGFLEIYLNLGLIGLALLCAVLVSFYKKSKAELYKQYDWGTLRVTFFIVAILYNITEASFRALTPIWLFLLLLNTEYPMPGSRQQGVDVGDG